jgi:hypothetical protein
MIAVRHRRRVTRRIVTNPAIIRCSLFWPGVRLAASGHVAPKTIVQLRRRRSLKRRFCRLGLLGAFCGQQTFWDWHQGAVSGFSKRHPGFLSLAFTSLQSFRDEEIIAQRPGLPDEHALFRLPGMGIQDAQADGNGLDVLLSARAIRQKLEQG